MGYKVIYPQVGKRRYSKYRKMTNKTQLAVLVTICFVLVLAVIHWSVGLSWLLPGDPIVTENALREMIDSLRAGEALGQAVVTFCREVVAGAR